MYTEFEPINLGCLPILLQLLYFYGMCRISEIGETTHCLHYYDL